MVHVIGPVPLESREGAVYWASCFVCSAASYVGQTSTTMKDKIKEHKYALRTGDGFSIGKTYDEYRSSCTSGLPYTLVCHCLRFRLCFGYVSAFTCVVTVSNMAKGVASFLCLLSTLQLVRGASEAIYGRSAATIYNGERLVFGEMQEKTGGR